MDAIEFFINFFQTLFGKEKLNGFKNKLLLNESSDLTRFILICVVSGLIFLTSGMIVLFYIGLDIDRVIILGIILFFAPFFLFYLWQDILFEKRKKKKEDLLAELLLEASVFYDENSLLKNIKKMSQIDLPFNKDFERVLREINNGSNIIDALNRMKILNQSKSIDRVIDLFLHGYESGLKMEMLLKETAQDLLENNSILKERQAVMLVTKYTLFLASGLIVPSIIGLIIGLVNGLNFGLVSNLEIGLSIEARKELFELAVLGAGIYIFEFGLMSSFFLALQENNKKQFWIYALLLIPVSFTCFFLAQTFI
jgi:hypothetical protein